MNMKTILILISVFFLSLNVEASTESTAITSSTLSLSIATGDDKPKIISHKKRVRRAKMRAFFGGNKSTKRNQKRKSNTKNRKVGATERAFLNSGGDLTKANCGGAKVSKRRKR